MQNSINDYLLEGLTQTVERAEQIAKLQAAGNQNNALITSQSVRKLIEFVRQTTYPAATPTGDLIQIQANEQGLYIVQKGEQAIKSESIKTDKPLNDMSHEELIEIYPQLDATRPNIRYQYKKGKLWALVVLDSGKYDISDPLTAQYVGVKPRNADKGSVAKKKAVELANDRLMTLQDIEAIAKNTKHLDEPTQDTHTQGEPTEEKDAENKQTQEVDEKSSEPTNNTNPSKTEKNKKGKKGKGEANETAKNQVDINLIANGLAAKILEAVSETDNAAERVASVQHIFMAELERYDKALQLPILCTLAEIEYQESNAAELEEIINGSNPQANTPSDVVTLLTEYYINLSEQDQE